MSDSGCRVFWGVVEGGYLWNTLHPGLNTGFERFFPFGFPHLYHPDGSENTNVNKNAKLKGSYITVKRVIISRFSFDEISKKIMVWFTLIKSY